MTRCGTVVYRSDEFKNRNKQKEDQILEKGGTVNKMEIKRYNEIKGKGNIQHENVSEN